MRKTLAIASTAALLICGSAFAQSSSAPADMSRKQPALKAQPQEGRASNETTKSGNPNGKGNALNGASGAPDATRNNGQ